MKWVTTEGMGAHENKARARDAAIANALELAVAQVVGLYVESETVTKNTRLLESRVLARTRGFIAEYEPMEGSETWEPNNVCRIKVRARVILGKVKGALDALGGDLELAGDPRVVLALSPPEGVDVVSRGIAAGRIRDRLVLDGVSVTDSEQLEESRRQDVANLRRLGAEASAEALELMDLADLVVKGAVAVRPMGQDPDAKWFRAKAVVDAWAAVLGTGEIVGSCLADKTVGAFTQAEAIDKAMAAAAEEWLRTAIGQVKIGCVSPAHKYRVSLLNVQQSSFVATFRELLFETRFVREVRDRGFNRPYTHIDVLYVGPLSNLLADIAAFAKLDPPVRLIEETHDGSTVAYTVPGQG